MIPLEKEAIFGTSDMIDVEEFLALHRPRGDSPEKTLLIAILSDAIHILVKTVPRGRFHPAYRETVNWFNSKSMNTPFTFYSICEILNIPPGVFLRRLEKYLHYR